ncbi:MAG: thioredoxin domain-containing protein [Bryobacteraceae bacterium]
MHTNRLAREKSPYLLQHAQNPVDWYPWGPEAFDRARREDKPIFVSIGYSTCHWCHVMERESFENERIATLLNTHFVPVKVDREERPDVDRVYMTFVQATTGGGGWPMSVWLTPDLRPFFGGTYYPPEDRWGRPGFATVLERLADAWRSRREQILASSADVIEALRRRVETGAAASLPVDERTLEGGFQAFRRTFDVRRGGFGGAPKFPRPAAFNFLLRYWARTGNADALEMTVATLRAMAAGGMYDQLGGGFHRYSVDDRWFVPHFEKMLYDQAQLAVSYLEAWQITHDGFFAGTARETLDYLLRDMRAPEGGFYSAEDADSEGREGAFYIWTREEIERTAGTPAAHWFCHRYGVEDRGNVAADPHGEFRGNNILYRARTLEETAAHFGKPLTEVESGLLQARRELLAVRERRPRPHRDDKILTAWNGLAVSAFARAGAVLDSRIYLEAARAAADFVAARAYASGRLLRRYREGEAAIPGFLDDYAFFIQGLLDLYEAAGEIRDLELAIALAGAMRELFEDGENGGFYSAAENPELVLRIKEVYDGAEPSGNSIAILDLLRLAAMTGRADFRRSAERALAAFAPAMERGPEAMPQMLAAAGWTLARPRQIILAGGAGGPDTAALLHAAHAPFAPAKILLLLNGDRARGVISGCLPAVLQMSKAGGKAAAYVCEDYTCRLPVSEPEKLTELLK